MRYFINVLFFFTPVIDFIEVKLYNHLNTAFNILLRNLHCAHWSLNSSQICCICGNGFHSLQISGTADKDVDYVVSSVSFPRKVKCLQEHKEHHVWVPYTTRPAEIILQMEKRFLSASRFSHFPQFSKRNTMIPNPLLTRLQLQLSISLLHILPFW